MMQDIFYKGVWRMDWGFGNPNTTAAFIATLMVAVWVLAYIRKWGFGMALVLFIGLGACLIHTFSRGGMIAAFFGLAPLLFFSPRPWPRLKMISLVAAIWVMLGLALFWNAHQRYAQGIVTQDRSISNRWDLWKYAPAMMTDAPGGWGFHKAAQAYMQWYQPVDRTETYRTFVNSHLEWLIEMGWPLRFLYVFAWLGIFVFCWPNEKTRWFAVPLGVWLAFAIAAVFSSVAESPWLWMVPILCLVSVGIYRLRKHLWPKGSVWKLPTIGAFLVILAFGVAGQSGLKIRGGQGWAILGEGKPKVWVISDPKILGQQSGKTLRKFFNTSARLAAIGIAESLEKIPYDSETTLIISGKINDAEISILSSNIAGKLVLVSPGFFPQELKLPGYDSKKIEVVFGEFSQSSSIDAWQDAASVRQIAGAGDFIPHWPENLLGNQP